MMDVIKLKKELKRLEDVYDAAYDLYRRGLASINCLNDAYRDLEKQKTKVSKYLEDSADEKEKANG